MTREDEREMVERIRSGDTAACGVCVESHSPTLFRLAFRILGDEAEAEDVLQDTFVSAFKAIGNFDGRSGLGTWLYRIAYNHSLMRLRTKRDSISLDERDDADAAPLPELAVSDDSPDELIIEHETTRLLGEAVNSLPATLREVFVLREIEGMSTAETADKLGISESAAKVRLHRARLALRESLGAYFEERVPADPSPTQSLACGEALRFIGEAESRGERVDESLKQSLREYIAQCEQCRLLLDPKHRSVLFYCGEQESSVPPAVRKRLYDRIQTMWSRGSRN